MRDQIEVTMSSVVKWAGFFIVAIMAIWLAISPISPNFVQGRMTMGFVMIGLGYLIDIKRLLERRP